MEAIETRTSGLHNTTACLVHDCPFGEYVRTISNTVISATIVGMLDTRSFPGMNPINHPVRVSILHRVTNFLKAWGKLRETPQVLHPTTPDCGGASCYHCGAPANWKHLEEGATNLETSSSSAVSTAIHPAASASAVTLQSAHLPAPRQPEAYCEFIALEILDTFVEEGNIKQNSSDKCLRGSNEFYKYILTFTFWRFLS